jgi:hypothetical protein
VRAAPVPHATLRAPVSLRWSRARHGRRRCSPPHRFRRLPSPTTRASPTSLRLTVRTRAFSSWYKKNTLNILHILRARAHTYTYTMCICMYVCMHACMYIMYFSCRIRRMRCRLLRE